MPPDQFRVEYAYDALEMQILGQLARRSDRRLLMTAITGSPLVRLRWLVLRSLMGGDPQRYVVFNFPTHVLGTMSEAALEAVCRANFAN